ncbi:MAG: hypothetical protein LBR31_04690 [Desulfovibrio sp.]|nr:hypothetical protein [Desulfovibrio sp.]
MKIRSDQINNLLSAQGAASGTPDRQTKAPSAFDDILAEEQLKANSAGSVGATVPPLPGAGNAGIIQSLLLGSLNGVEAEQSVHPDEAVLNEAFNQVSGTLDLLDKYSASLGTAGSLKDAYSLLSDFDGNVESLEKSAGALRAQHPEMDSLLNELKIISVTEKIKFNRGDYLPE